MRAKYTSIAKALEARVREGDYALTNLPGERRIAEEFGVSHMTARRAVQELLSQGVLSRPRGVRNATNPKRVAKPHQLRICCVMPAFPASSYYDAYIALSKLITSRRGIVRAVMYVHEEDPAIQQALLGDFDGVFMVPPHQPSQLLLDHMVRNRNKLVTLWYDHTNLGIPCVDDIQIAGMAKLVEYLASLGHRRIDCLNTQPDDMVVRGRITNWRQTLQQLGLSGDLYDLAVQPFSDAHTAAREHTQRLIQTNRLTSTAMVCVTTGAAIGVCRAMRDAHIEVGRDYSVCGFADIAAAKLYSPSLTAAEPEDLSLYLKMGLDWILSGGKTPSPSLLFQPTETHVWVGESTGPVPETGI